MKTHVFITGMPRSGTTLVDKVVSLHEDAHVLSQPLPLLYVHLKRAFLASRSEGPLRPDSTSFPLNDMIGPNYYPPESFLEFLESQNLSSDWCRKALEEMVDFEGQYTKPADPLRILDGYQPGSLFQFVTSYCELLVREERLVVIGSKETYCEEFVPYFLSCGAAVIMIIRDPRDIITSLNHGSGSKFGGRINPHLFNILQWRKGVAFALAHGSHPNFVAIRYEDLVRNRYETVGRLCRLLSLEAIPAHRLDRDIRTRSGEIWRSNSSHELSTRISARSIGTHQRFLSPALIRFVEATCFPEMKEMGYELAIEREEVAHTIDEFRETETLERPELKMYLLSDERRAEEIGRWRRLQEKDYESSVFLFPKAFEELAR